MSGRTRLFPLRRERSYKNAPCAWFAQGALSSRPYRVAGFPFRSFPGESGARADPPEHEVRGSGHAQSRPDEIHRYAFSHVQDAEAREDAHRDDFLHDLELPEGKEGISDAVCGNLEAVFEEGDAPAHEDGDDDRFGIFCVVDSLSNLKVKWILH